MSVTIREFTPADYEGIAEVDSSVWPDYPETAEHLKEGDDNRDQSQLFARFVAERAGRIVGVSGYEQWPRDTPRFWAWIHVHRDEQGRGHGKALYDHLLTELDARGATTLRAEAREGDERGNRFLEDRGFVLEMTERESALDVESFQPEAWASDAERATAQGIVIKSYAELRAEATDQEALHRALYELHMVLDEDVPDVDAKVHAPFEEWAKRFGRTLFFPEAHMYALDGSALVGASLLWRRPADGDLDTGLTGVRREYRKRGIATALKVRALAAAKAYGAQTIRTTNEKDNVGMLGINYRLGFQPRPAWLFYGKKLRPEADAPAGTVADSSG
jgi:GNAT superfamily N-acetyltransferase